VGRGPPKNLGGLGRLAAPFVAFLTVIPGRCARPGLGCAESLPHWSTAPLRSQIALGERGRISKFCEAVHFVARPTSTETRKVSGKSGSPSRSTLCIGSETCRPDPCPRLPSATLRLGRRSGMRHIVAFARLIPSRASRRLRFLRQRTSSGSSGGLTRT
jgi:hypothetical protein